MPWIREGASARAASPAIVGASSPTGGEIEVDAADDAGARDGQRAVTPRDVSAHLAEDLAQQRTRLRRVQRPIRHGHAAPRDERRRQEGRGVGQIRLDRDVFRADGRRGDDPLAHARTLDVHSAPCERLDRHVDVRQARQVRPSCTRWRPVSKRGAASSRPETN